MGAEDPYEVRFEFAVRLVDTILLLVFITICYVGPLQPIFRGGTPDAGTLSI